MKPPRRILFVKICCIGDVLKTTPVLEAVKSSFPDAKTSFLVSSWALDAIRANPHVDDFIIFDAPYSKNPLKKALLSARYLKKMRGFDWALIFHRNPMAALLTRIAGVPERIGFVQDKSNRHLTLSVQYDSSRHEVDRYIELAKALGIQVERKDCRLYVPDEVRVSTLKLLESLDLGGIPFVSLHLGGGVNPGKYMPIKRWPQKRFAELANILVGDYGFKVLWVGGKEDLPLMEEIEGNLKVETKKLVGRTTFLELAGILERSTLFVGGDSGPLHIAAAVGTKTVGIFGPSDPRLVAPIGEGNRVIWKRVHCSPCYTPRTAHEDFSLCPLGTFECMTSVDVNDVLEAVIEMLEDKGVGEEEADQGIIEKKDI